MRVRVWRRALRSASGSKPSASSQYRLNGSSARASCTIPPIRYSCPTSNRIPISGPTRSRSAPTNSTAALIRQVSIAPLSVGGSPLASPSISRFVLSAVNPAASTSSTSASHSGIVRTVGTPMLWASGPIARYDAKWLQYSGSRSRYSPPSSS